MENEYIKEYFPFLQLSWLFWGYINYTYRAIYLEEKTDFCNFLWYFENPATLVFTMTLITSLLFWGYDPSRWVVINVIFAMTSIFWVIIGLCCNLRFTPYLLTVSFVWICLSNNLVIPALGIGVLSLFFVSHPVVWTRV